MNTSKRIRVHIFVSGRVQGVFFRNSTRAKALELGLTGWVKNLSDGRVEAVFEGEKAQVEQILEWAKSGPPGAKIEALEPIFEAYEAEFTDFEVKYE